MKYPGSCYAMAILSFIVILAYILSSSLAIELDYIHVSKSLSDGMTLVSQGEIFELGFFSPGKSQNRYLGIWYKKIPVQTVVWVANRANPINGSSGILTLNSTGNLVLKENETIIWNTASQKQAKNPVLELLDSGNLVLRNDGDSNPKAYLWQSFDYPCDTQLPGMKTGRDLQNGFDWRVTSWKSPVDPSLGDLSYGLVLSDYPEFSIMNGTKKFSRIGPWNGLNFGGVPNMKYEYMYELSYVTNKDEIFYSFSTKIDSLITRVVINQTSEHVLTQYVWDDKVQHWKLFSSLPADVCDYYGFCGAFGYCSAADTHVCQCLKGFSPKSPKAWNLSIWTQGCVRNEPLSCNVTSSDGFLKYTGFKEPDTQHTRLIENINLEDCEVLCLKNCSCMAYANSDIREGGRGCVMWFGDLIDLKLLQGGEQTLYIRMPASELEISRSHKKKVITSATIAATFGMLLLCYVIYKVQRNIAEKSKAEYFEGYVNDTDLPMFDLLMISNATDNFSLNNKIGQGGFGTVYKGKLADGQEIAVKRLSHSSGQGMTEFLTEVKLIAKLQHRNLVKLLGCCVRGQEKLLVYEYMVNGSLDNFIFDRMKSKLLEWPQRFLIIFGVARGLLYLHHDSRLRIIHRDLKLSNILLDDKLNPKISDFGIARAFGVDQTHGNTNRVIGTYGYMAPEYAINGLFSVKSDVFSFGVILMEIISGNRNRALLCHANETFNLVGYAWMLWKEDRPLELIDPNIKESCVVPEVLRCIHVSLLCVQQHPEDRPTMASVLLMLGSKMDLVEPKEPGFFSCKLPTEVSSHSDQHNMTLNDELTITSLDGR